MVTIYDIAREAGVSPATVSRMLTGNAKVSEEKRKRITELIRAYDYKPNALAKGLRETKSRVIGMILVDFVNPFYATLLSSCEKEARKRGYSLIVTSTLGDRELEDAYLDTMCQQRVATIVMVGGRSDELAPDEGYVGHVKRIAESVPVVTNGYLDGAEGCRVRLDEEKAAELAVEYLRDLGHREIAFIGGKGEIRSTVEKRLKYAQLLMQNGLPTRKEWIVDGPGYDDKSGYEAMRKLLALPCRPTAVIAVNDFTAAGVAHAIWEEGLGIPEDFSLVSFDDTYVSNLCRPRLTSVSYDLEEFASRLIGSAVDIAHGRKIEQNQVVEPKLVVRDSCKQYGGGVKKEMKIF